MTVSRYLVTGSAGFIGFHVAKRLLERGEMVCGLDNMNEYYDVDLKRARMKILYNHQSYRFECLDLADRSGMEDLFASYRPDVVIHLAAQAGVRYSVTNPHVYVSSNITGFLHVLEGCRQVGGRHLVYASTSSVYGANTKMPFSVHDSADHPLTLYAATKKANELMAHSYSHLYGMAVTGLRFFTVYGPWGRPDMALFRFTKSILEGEAIDVYNGGQMRRDFTYVDDIAEGVVRAADRVARPNPDWSGSDPDPATSTAAYRLYNIGNNQPVELMRYIAVLEEAIGKKATLNMLPMQAGDVPATWADVDDLTRDVGYTPSTPIEVGVRRFVDWYREYYAV